MAVGERHRGRPASPQALTAAGWRRAVTTASTLNLLAGVWLISSPFLLAYRPGEPRWNDIVFGALVAVLALTRVSGEYRASEFSWASAVAGVWIFASAFWLDTSRTATTNDLVLGVIVFALGLASATASKGATR
jgi:hypothetical protein